jgi:hypothetical protein
MAKQKNILDLIKQGQQEDTETKWMKGSCRLPWGDVESLLTVAESGGFAKSLEGYLASYEYGSILLPVSFLALIPASPDVG